MTTKEYGYSKAMTDFINGRPCLPPAHATSEEDTQYIYEWGLAGCRRDLVLLRASALGVAHEHALSLFGHDQ